MKVIGKLNGQVVFQSSEHKPSIAFWLMSQLRTEQIPADAWEVWENGECVVRVYKYSPGR